MIEKNKSYLADVVDLTLEGNGICKVEGFTIFVPLTAVGDQIRMKIVKLQKHFGFGLLEEIITPAETRCEPDCAVYRQCGGCNFRHIRYEEELRLKEKVVTDAFTRIGGFSVLPEPIIGAEEQDGYRNKVQLPVGLDQDGKAVAGFFAKRSHRLIHVTGCRIQDKQFEPVVEFVMELVREKNIPIYDEASGKGLLRHIFLRRGRGTGEMMLCLVATDRTAKLWELATAVAAVFPEVVSIYLNINAERTNVILGKKYKLLHGKDALTDRLLDVEFSIAPAAFYQVNREQAARLYTVGYQYAEFTGKELLLDLYCGIGAIGLCAYHQVGKLVGVEVVKTAVESAKENAVQNGMERTSFFCGDAKDAAKKLANEGLSPDVVVVDPPRKGCEGEVLEAILQMAPKKIIMISCDPATAARDCKRLCEGEYELIKYRPVDMFPRTGHVECVILISKVGK